MSRTWKRRLNRMLQEGEMFGLVFTTLMLIVVEGCFIYWLYRIPLLVRPFYESGFLAMPPWYQKPRFEVTLLLTIVACLLFSVCGGLWDVWRHRSNAHSANTVESVRQRLWASMSITAVAGFDLALVILLR